jgi:hypothetical protein
MIVRAGVQTFEFQQVYEVPKLLNFDRDEDALNWLRQLWSQDPDLIRRFREYLARYAEDEKVFRLTDHQAIERLAVLLHSRRVRVVARENRRGRGSAGPRVETADAPFPVSEPKRRAASNSDGAQAKTPRTAPLWIRLDLTQAQAAKETGRMRLVGSTGYDQTLAISSNFVANPVEANTVDLLFEDVPTSASYSLTYTGGDGSTITIVQGAAFDSLKDDSMDAPEPESTEEADSDE